MVGGFGMRVAERAALADDAALFVQYQRNGFGIDAGPSDRRLGESVFDLGLGQAEQRGDELLTRARVDTQRDVGQVGQTLELQVENRRYLVLVRERQVDRLDLLLERPDVREGRPDE